MFEASILTKRMIADRTVEITFSVPETQFKFTAGQHVEVYLKKLTYDDPKGLMRIFSIASSPRTKGTISIAFRESGSGYKKSLLALPKGSSVALSSPLGHFTLPEKAMHPLVFIAAGIGITPFLSMLTVASEQKLPYDITLLYANRDAKSVAYMNELEALEKHNKKIRLKKIYGRIEHNHLLSLMKNVNNPLWYIAGPPLMISNTLYMLTSLGINPTAIFHESFIGY